MAQAQPHAYVAASHVHAHGGGSGCASPAGPPPTAHGHSLQMWAPAPAPLHTHLAAAAPPQTHSVAAPMRSCASAPRFSTGQSATMPSAGADHSSTVQSACAGAGAESLQAEITRRQAAEQRVRELDALVARLRHRVAVLEGKRPGPCAVADGVPKGARTARASTNGAAEARIQDEPQVADAIDGAICDYLERNPDFPVSIQKVAQNYYVFGDRGTVYVTQRGDHIVVRVGGGFKSLQVFMDERALMVTSDSASAGPHSTH